MGISYVAGLMVVLMRRDSRMKLLLLLLKFLVLMLLLWIFARVLTLSFDVVVQLIWLRLEMVETMTIGLIKIEGGR